MSFTVLATPPTPSTRIATMAWAGANRTSPACSRPWSRWVASSTRRPSAAISMAPAHMTSRVVRTLLPHGPLRLHADLLQELHHLEAFAGASHHAGERIVRDPHGHQRFG